MKTRKKPVIITAVLILAALSAAWWHAARRPFIYSGDIEATEVTLSPRLSAVIAEYKVDEGAPVKKGQLLIALECDDILLNADIAAKDYERAKELNASGTMSRENYDRLKYKRDDALLRASWCHIKSPVDGVALYKYREAGELVAPGAKLLTVADLSEVDAMVYVPHDMLARLKVNMPVTGVLPELKNRQFPGRIAVINEEAEFTPRNVQTRGERTRLVFGVKTKFANPDGLLKPGMTLEITLPD